MSLFTTELKEVNHRGKGGIYLKFYFQIFVDYSVSFMQSGNIKQLNKQLFTGVLPLMIITPLTKNCTASILYCSLLNIALLKSFTFLFGFTKKVNYLSNLSLVPGKYILPQLENTCYHFNCFYIIPTIIKILQFELSFVFCLSGFVELGAAQHQVSKR